MTPITLPLSDKGPFHLSKGRNGFFQQTTLLLTDGWGDNQELFLLQLLGKSEAINAQCFLSLEEIQALHNALSEILQGPLPTLIQSRLATDK